MLLPPLLIGELGGVTLCPTAGLTGFPCPGCGLTRAGLELLRGRVAQAWAYHPLIFVVGPAVALYLMVLTIDAFWPLAWFRTSSTQHRVSLAGLMLAILLFGVWIARFAGAFGGPVATDAGFW